MQRVTARLLFAVWNTRLLISELLLTATKCSYIYNDKYTTTKSSLPRGMEPQFSAYPAHSVIAVLTELTYSTRKKSILHTDNERN
jgi:hypothetical protein